jgi:hypothetical protein
MEKTKKKRNKQERKKVKWGSQGLTRARKRKRDKKKNKKKNKKKKMKQENSLFCYALPPLFLSRQKKCEYASEI